MDIKKKILKHIDEFNNVVLTGLKDLDTGTLVKFTATSEAGFNISNYFFKTFEITVNKWSTCNEYYFLIKNRK